MKIPTLDNLKQIHRERDLLEYENSIERFIQKILYNLTKDQIKFLEEGNEIDFIYESQEALYESNIRGFLGHIRCSDTFRNYFKNEMNSYGWDIEFDIGDYPNMLFVLSILK